MTSLETLLLVISYFPLVIIVIGLLGNTISFMIFTFHPEMNKYSSMIYLSFIAVFDTLGLFIWNLDHYLNHNFNNFWIEQVNLGFCKFFTFLQYQSLQTSGLMYSMISVDRYFTVIKTPGSFVSKLPFGTRKSAYIWSICIIIAVFLINIHVLIYNGTFVPADNGMNTTANQTENQVMNLLCYTAESYDFSLISTYIQVIVYSIIPFTFMSIFNGLLIKTVLYKRKYVSKGDAANIRKERKNRKLTISFVILTITFLVITIPGTIANGFFYFEISSTFLGSSIPILLDTLMFLQQTMLFLISFLTNKTFKSILKRYIFCKNDKNLSEISAGSRKPKTKL